MQEFVAYDDYAEEYAVIDDLYEIYGDEQDNEYIGNLVNISLALLAQPFGSILILSDFWVFFRRRVRIPAARNCHPRSLSHRTHLHQGS